MRARRGDRSLGHFRVWSEDPEGEILEKPAFIIRRVHWIVM
jgi:hypothetical protein